MYFCLSCLPAIQINFLFSTIARFQRQQGVAVASFAKTFKLLRTGRRGSGLRCEPNEAESYTMRDPMRIGLGHNSFSS